MTQIRCLTCTAYLTAPDAITPNELADANNWLPVRIEGVDGWLCDRCSKWADSPIKIWRYREPECFLIEKRTI